MAYPYKSSRCRSLNLGWSSHNAHPCTFLSFRSSFSSHPLYVLHLCTSGTILIDGVELPTSHQVNRLYRQWYHQSHGRNEMPIENVDVAVKMQLAGLDCIVVRVKVLIAWRWGFTIYGDRQVAFVIGMKPKGEEKVQRYLSVHNTGMLLELPMDHEDYQLYRDTLQYFKSKGEPIPRVERALKIFGVWR